MGKLTYFPLVLDRWISGTRFLSLEEKGAYLELLCYLYEDRERYIRDEAHVARILGVRKERATRIFRALNSKFTRIKQGYYHSFVRELHRNGMKLRGLQGEALPTETRNQKLEEEEKKEEKLKQKEERKPPADFGFDEWWKAYPKKVGRAPCLKIWKQRRLGQMADELIADIARRAEHDGRWLDGFIPNPQTYLNQNRWEDELQPRSKPQKPRNNTYRGKDENLEAMAAQLGLPAKPGESTEAWHVRIRAAATRAH